MTGNRKSIDTLKLTDIGIRLRCLRDTLNITLEKMKELTGISRSYISDFERGRKLPSSKYLFFLIEDFDADINYIFTGRGEMFLRTKKEAENYYDFGKYEEEIND
ncbi:helix-turn-helix domain-containing protein, partial [Acidobacteriota bacterium]